MSSIPFTSFVDFYKLYRRIFRMSYCGAECDLIEDKTIEQYKDYVINEDGLKYIIKDYPDIMTNERSKISFLIHYDIAKYVTSKDINIDDTYITIYSYNDFLKSMMFSDIDKHDSISIFEYIFVERFGANNYESVVGAYRSI